MEKIKIDAKTFAKLHNLCEIVQAPREVEGKVLEHLREMETNNQELIEQAEMLGNDMLDTIETLHNRALPTAVESLLSAVNRVERLQEYLDCVQNNLFNTLSALRQVTTPDAWAPLYTDEEMEQAINRGYELTNVMSLGHQNGLYALLFEENEGDGKYLCEPFVFAIGGDEDLCKVREYVEKFLDMEDED